VTRLRGLIVCTTAGLALAVAALPGSAPGADSPALKAKHAEATLVLNEISALDERLSVLTERYDGARVHLQAVEKRLRAERIALTRARRQYHQATTQIARLVVSLYNSGSPSSLEAILGAGSLEKMVAIADDQIALAHARTQIATTAKDARAQVQATVIALRANRQDAARSLRNLAETRQTVVQGLAQRQRLLASVKTQIAHLEAEQRARQRRLLAAARARLAAEERAAAQRAARAAALAKAQAERAAAAADAAAATTDPSGTTTDPTATALSADPTLTDPTSTDGTSTAEATAPEAPVTAPGHPEAAALALDYIGVPYLWGGATPAGFDCSGLVTYVFAQLGIQLPHFAAAQYTYGVAVPRDQLQPGDLVFFDNLDHVGIYIGANEIVNAPHTGAYVRIDNLSEPWYANRYVGARRI